MPARELRLTEPGVVPAISLLSIPPCGKSNESIHHCQILCTATRRRMQRELQHGLEHGSSAHQNQAQRAQLLACMTFEQCCEAVELR